MKKFTNILKQILTEATRLDFLVNKYLTSQKTEEGTKKPLLTKQEFATLLSADPDSNTRGIDYSTAQEADLNKIKPGKYMDWIIQRYLEPTTERQPGERGYEEELRRAKEMFIGEDLDKLTRDLLKYDRFKGRLEQDKRNIFNIKSKEELNSLVKGFSLEKVKTTKEEKKQIAQSYAHPGANIVHSGPNWTVVKITENNQLGKDAAIFFGGNKLGPEKGETDWCTSSPGYNWFERYITKGPLYVVLPNNWTGERGQVSNLPAKRYQFHFQEAQFMDVSDHQIKLADFFKGEGEEMKEYFKPEFAKGLTVDGKKLVITEFDRGAVGKFISIYGLDDLIDALPVDLKNFQIQNKDRDFKIDLKIPQSFDRFQQLRLLNLDNCVSSIPDTICNIKTLKFISLPNNPNLKSLPDCLFDLPQLYFLSLAGSPNCKINMDKVKDAQMLDDRIWDFSGESPS